MPKGILLTVASVVLCAFASTGRADEPDFSAADVDAAIQKGTEFLLSQQNADGSWGEHKFWSHTYPVGMTCLVTYSLLEAGVSPQNEKLQKALDWLAEQDPEKVYEVSFRAAVWAAANAKTNQKYLRNLQWDVDTLTRSQVQGAYHYDVHIDPRVAQARLGQAQRTLSTVSRQLGQVQGLIKQVENLLKRRLSDSQRSRATELLRKYKEEEESLKDEQKSLKSEIKQLEKVLKRGRGGDDKNKKWDNSNSQYGLYGVWMGVLGGLEIKPEYWSLVMKHWLACQAEDGGWNYRGFRPKKGTASMTTAGLASLFVCYDMLHQKDFIECKGNAKFKPIEDGLKWMEDNFAKSLNDSKSYYYYYGVERVALASGYKYFGEHDWYQSIASWLVDNQERNGSWDRRASNHSGKTLGATSYALLFLVRGRRAVLFNKLEHAGDWNNRPRDLASLTRWISKEFESTVQWQIINLSVPVREWHDAPILYLSGTQKPPLKKEEIAQLREFVLQGGTIFSTTACGEAGFKKGIREVYEEMFPEYELVACDPRHDVYNVHYPLNRSIQMYEISNGVRPLVIHTDYDVSKYWQTNRTATNAPAYQVMANVVAYTNGKGALAGQLRTRGSNIWPAEYRGRGGKSVSVVRVRHNGHWNPEPLAIQRIARQMGHEHSLRVEELDPVDPDKLLESKARVALLTGTGELRLTLSQRDALKKFVDDGGTLVVDTAGGDTQFARTAERVLQETFGRRALRPLRSSTGLLNLKGNEIKEAHFRGQAVKIFGPKDGIQLRVVMDGRREAVLFSREDITAGLVGYDSHTVSGYTPETARSIMRNVLLSASR